MLSTLILIFSLLGTVNSFTPAKVISTIFGLNRGDSVYASSWFNAQRFQNTAGDGNLTNSGNLSGNTNPISIITDGDKTVTATFVQKPSLFPASTGSSMINSGFLSTSHILNLPAPVTDNMKSPNIAFQSNGSPSGLDYFSKKPKPSPEKKTKPTPTHTPSPSPIKTSKPVPTIVPSPGPTTGTPSATLTPAPISIPVSAAPVGEINLGGGSGVNLSDNRIFLLNYMNQPGIFDTEASIKTDNGLLTISIPKGTQARTKEGWALSYITALRVTQDQEPAAPPGGYIIGLPYNLGPEGTMFNPAINISLNYDKSQIPAGISDLKIVLARWDTVTSQWKILDSIVDEDKGIINASTNSFSIYAVVGFVPPPVQTITSPITPFNPAPASVLPPVQKVNISPAISPKVEAAVTQAYPTKSTPTSPAEIATNRWPLILGIVVAIAGITTITFIISRRNV